MLAALLVFGGVNFLILRNTSKENALPRLRRLIEAEVGIGITVILTAASLTSQPPAVDQVSETVTWHQIYQRFKPTVPRLTYEYVAEAAAPSGPPAAAPEAPAGRLVCSSPGCGRTLTQGQYDFSANTFGMALCPSCQRKQQARGKEA